MPRPPAHPQLDLPERCRWDGSRRPRVVPGRHDPALCPAQQKAVPLPAGQHEDEPARACTGCLPCPRPHCCVCGRAHTTTTCTGCRAEIRHDLAQLALLYSGALRGQELADAAAGDDPAESEALALRGPVAHQETWWYLSRAGVVLDDYDPRNPLWVLGTWELAAREWLDDEPTAKGAQPVDTRSAVTVLGAARYLEQRLDDIAELQDAPLHRLRQEVADSVRHVLAVVGDAAELRRQCPSCGEDALERRWQAKAGDYQPGDELRRYDDMWACRRCRAAWTDADYRAKVEATYVRVADRLTLRDMAERTGVPAGTLRRWAAPRRVQRSGQPMVTLPSALARVGRGIDGRYLYLVADVEKLRDTPIDTPGLDEPDRGVSK